MTLGINAEERIEKIPQHPLKRIFVNLKLFYLSMVMPHIHLRNKETF